MTLKKNSLLNALNKKTIIAIACTGILYPVNITAAKQPFPKFKQVKLFQEQEEKIYSLKKLDKKPQFVGGESKIYEYIYNNLSIPEINKDITVKTKMSFVIEKDGSITNITIEKGGEYGIGEEAVRVLKKMPSEWIPGQKNGKAVRSRFIITATIKISN
ncbi:hypothetical protein GN157_03425 [Flavobacterium rakeshii]|uniref:TonB C-terminal domain-containing protein n=1 Tax=Flavobacterium rakeshii TaxID=1038845 RepID=A0A6N8H816_9FLAO|nr:energy transducer TonB [Flavobacterium rakeshii]MEE1897860.1 energy transducer TonB [Flavobacterium rakeshii]MUV02749.1 hypothetical protein [Flavobacterium rakeshii]